jgi:large subunit ribosomal protein L44e
MKIPKTVNTYCPKCKAQTTHTISVYKKGRDRVLSAGNRRHEREKHGYGGQKYPELKRTAKTSKKVVLNRKCKKCGYITQGKAIRIRKADIQ